MGGAVFLIPFAVAFAVIAPAVLLARFWARASAETRRQLRLAEIVVPLAFAAAGGLMILSGDPIRQRFGEGLAICFGVAAVLGFIRPYGGLRAGHKLSEEMTVVFYCAIMLLGFGIMLLSLFV